MAPQFLRIFLVASLIGLADSTIVAADGSTELTDIDKLRLEVAALKHEVHRARTERDQCRMELAPLRVKRDEDGLREVDAKLKADLEAAHPGYRFDPMTGQLAKVPDEPKNEKR